MPARHIWLLLAGAILLAAVCAAQRPFRVYSSIEPYDAMPLPPDWERKAEWVFGRLMYPNHPFSLFGRRGGFWLDGGTSWTQDYPRADRHFAMALGRLTRIDVRSIEQPINLDDGDDVYNWPFLFAGEMGDWKLTEAQAKTLREYLLRGGFLLLDDFWGPPEWARFEESMKLVFPDRPIVEIDDADPIFHTVYDLDDRYQIPGEWALKQPSRRALGTVAHWMGIFDDRQRLMVAIWFNSDVGDSWERADTVYYPEKYSALGIRLGVNHVVYSLTH